MLSGRVALGDLKVEFGGAEERFQKLAAEIEPLAEQETRLLAKERKLILDLSRIYLPELSPEVVTGGLDELEAAMAEALERQTERHRELEAELASLPEGIAKQELLLAEAERDEASAATGLETVRDAVEGELAADEAHGAAVAEHRGLMERRSVLTARRLRLSAVSSAERRRYESDRAFAYLRERGFGQPRYRAGFVSRRLDRWLARRIDYETLFRRYTILQEGVKVTTLELRDLTDRARRLEEQIDATEDAVGARHGLPAALNAYKAAQGRVLDARKAVTAARERYDRLAAELRSVQANRGKPYEDALAVHEAFLESRTVQELLTLARSTPDPKDDDLVRRLGDTRDRLASVGAELTGLRERLEELNGRTTSLGDLVRDVAQRFASRRSYFTEEADLSRLAASVMHGERSVDDARIELSRTHVAEPLLPPAHRSPIQGLLAELSAEFDAELGAVEVALEATGEAETEVVVYDHQGRLLHRRVTKRGGGTSS